MTEFVNAVPTCIPYIDPDWPMYEAQAIRLKRKSACGNTPDFVLRSLVKGKVPLRLFNQPGDDFIYFNYAGHTYFVNRNIVRFKQGPRFGQ